MSHYYYCYCCSRSLFAPDPHNSARNGSGSYKPSCEWLGSRQDWSKCAQGDEPYADLCPEASDNASNYWTRNWRVVGLHHRWQWVHSALRSRIRTLSHLALYSTAHRCWTCSHARRGRTLNLLACCTSGGNSDDCQVGSQYSSARYSALARSQARETA